MHRYINRAIEPTLQETLATFPVTALLGPRQCGKSTLAKHVLGERASTLLLDLERPSDLRKLDDPEFFLNSQRNKLVCLDEVQRLPDLFPVMRTLVDENRRNGRFLLLGSASQELLRQSSESLAGRIAYLELTPFTAAELIAHDRKRYLRPTIPWLRGGFPESVLAPSEQRSFAWREQFIRTFLERDIPQFGFSIPATRMRRFWTMLAHYHGQILNASKLGQALGVTHPTIRHYLDVMEQTYMVRMLSPFVGNVKKRLVKSPKVFLRDSGILHALLEIGSFEELLGHPIVGASWEGWCIEQITAAMPGWHPSFYRTSSGEEIDLLLSRGRTLLAFECKRSSAPKPSKGFAGTLEAIRPEHAWIVAPVKEPYELRSGVTVGTIETVLAELTSPKGNYFSVTSNCSRW